ncbi:GHMP kinase, partial [Irpex lacteus]
MAVEQDVLIACGPQVVGDGKEVRYGEVKARNLAPKYGPQEFVPTLISNTEVTSTENHTIHISEDPSASHDVQWHIDIDKSQLRWESYVKAGYYGVLERFFTNATKDASQNLPKPVDILVTGSVPAGSGLSSSAAMVVASTLAFLAVNDKLSPSPSSSSPSPSSSHSPSPGSPDSPQDGKRLTKGELVEMAVENEKRVGVNSGGMDQAASVTSLPTSALYISFFPSFSVESVPLPMTNSSSTPRAVFVCANSLVVSDKVVGAKTRYNLRVVETLVSARILARLLSLTSLLSPSSPTNKKFTLRHVLSAYLSVPLSQPLTPSELKSGLERLLREVGRLKAKVLRGEEEFVYPENEKGWEEEEIGGVGDEDSGVTLEEMVAFSGMGEEEFREVYLSWVDVEATHFHLYKRTKHVLTEALRVLQVRELCLSTSTSSPPTTTTTSPTILTRLGTLLTRSHTSCTTLYACSHPRLDVLTSLALSLGAYGSRLTGAGWGGCCISLVREDAVEGFVRGLREGYEEYKALGEEAFGEAVFVTRPGSGAF